MNTVLLVIIMVFITIFTGLNFLLLLSIMYNLHRVTENASVSRLRLDNTYEKLYKVENMTQMILQNIMSDHLLEYMPPHQNLKAIRTPGGIIMASSLEDFLSKIQHDPEFKGISKEQLEELRKLFEEGNINNDDEDNNNEPWKKEK